MIFIYNKITGAARFLAVTDGNTSTVNNVIPKINNPGKTVWFYLYKGAENQDSVKNKS